jgi:hypothetical protein
MFAHPHTVNNIVNNIHLAIQAHMHAHGASIIFMHKVPRNAATQLDHALTVTAQLILPPFMHAYMYRVYVLDVITQSCGDYLCIHVFRSFQISCGVPSVLPESLIGQSLHTCTCFVRGYVHMHTQK